MKAGVPRSIGIAAALAGASAQALPVGPAVVGATPGTGPAVTFAEAPGALTVTQATPRVAIDWRGFDIGKGETVAFVQGGANWVAFNRIAQGATIDGALTARGGVWLFSPGGLVFGPNAQVSVGSLFASTGVLGDRELSRALGGESFRLDANGRALDGVVAAPGARLTAAAGDVVLQGETIVQNGRVSASRSVDYVAADGASFRYSADAQGLSLTLDRVDALSEGSAPRIDHAGDTRAGGPVQVVSQAAEGRRSLINLSGYLEAANLNGDARTAIRIASAPAQQESSGAGLAVDTGSATLSTPGEVRVEASDTRLGAITAGRLTVRASGPLTLVGAVDLAGGADLRGDSVLLNGPLTAGGDVDGFSAGDFAVNAPIRAAGVIDLYARRDLLIAPVLVQSDASGGGAAPLYLTAGRDLSADAGTSLLAGAGEGGVRSSVTLVAGDQTPGDLRVGAVAGRTLNVFAAGDRTGGGRVTVAGPLSASRDITVESVGGAASGIRLLAALSAGGEARAFTYGGGALEVGLGVAITSGADGVAGPATERVWLASSGALTIGERARLSGGDGLILESAGLLQVLSGATLESRSGPAATALPFPLVLTPSTEDDGLPVGGVSLAGADIDLRGSVKAGADGDRRDVFIRLAPAGGGARFGGLDGDAAPRFSNAELQRVSGRTVYLAAEKGDVVVDDLTLDRSQLGKLWLGVRDGGALSVVGRVRPGASGGSDLAIGFIRSLDLSGAETVSYLPREIGITGSLGGSGTERLAAVSLAALGDILIGAPQFVADARAEASFDPLRRSSQYAADVTPGQLFVGAETLQVAASGRVLQQNTGSGVQDGGILVGAPGAGRPNIVALPSAGLTAPTRVELFGAFSNGDGTALTGPRPAITPGVLATTVPVSKAYRFNGCVIAATTSCSIAQTPAVLPQPQARPEQIVTPLALSEQGRTGDVFSLPKPDEEDAERDGFAQPVAGVGNDDLSTTRPSREGPP